MQATTNEQAPQAPTGLGESPRVLWIDHRMPWLGGSVVCL